MPLIDRRRHRGRAALAGPRQLCRKGRGLKARAQGVRLTRRWKRRSSTSLKAPFFHVTACGSVAAVLKVFRGRVKNPLCPGSTVAATVEERPLQGRVSCAGKDAGLKPGLRECA